MIETEAEPVFVGAHRKPEAVVMSVARYEQLIGAAQRRADVDDDILAGQVLAEEGDIDDEGRAPHDRDDQRSRPPAPRRDEEPDVGRERGSCGWRASKAS